MIFIITGVSGSGKTTLGKALAHRLGIVFCDADDFHPEASVERMRAGIPLEEATPLALAGTHEYAPAGCRTSAIFGTCLFGFTRSLPAKVVGGVTDRSTLLDSPSGAGQIAALPLAGAQWPLYAGKPFRLPVGAL